MRGFSLDARGEQRPGRLWRRLFPPVLTALIFVFIFWRWQIRFGAFLEALRGADYPLFLLLMVPNSAFYFAWDTLVLSFLMRWFHGPIRFRDLLPVRAVTYVVALMNTQLARGAMAYYLTRQLRVPFFEIASTVIFLVLVETAHLTLWATGGMLLFPENMPPGMFWVPVGFAAFWLFFLLYTRRDFAPWRVLLAPLSRRFPAMHERLRLRRWSIFRTFNQAPLKRYAQLVLLRTPMFCVSLVFHYLAVKAFGIDIPFGRMLAFLPIIFLVPVLLPITVANLGTTQTAWIFFFSAYAPGSKLLAFSLAARLAFVLTRGLLGLVFLPRAYRELFGPHRAEELLAASRAASTHPAQP